MLTDTTDNSSPGELRTTIAAAKPGDTINFQTGLSGTIPLSASLGILTINQDLTILGGGVITLSGQNPIPVLVNHSTLRQSPV